MKCVEFLGKHLVLVVLRALTYNMGKVRAVAADAVAFNLNARDFGCKY